MAFQNLGLMDELCRGVEEMEWKLPTSIQEEAIPLILGGGDVMAAAETGSGKTGAFALPIIQITWESIEEMKRQKDKPKALSNSDNSQNDNTVRMSLLDKTPAIAMDPSGLVVQSRDDVNWAGCRATRGVTRGAYCYEVHIKDDGLARVGWSTQTATLDLGTDAKGFGFGGTGKKSHNKRFDAYGEIYKKGDVITCYINFNDNTIFFSKNGKSLGKAFDIPKNLLNFAFYPAVALKNCEVEFKFDDSQCSVDPGYTLVGKAAENDIVVNSNNSNNSKSNKSNSVDYKSCRVLVIEPTRELAQQMIEMIEKFIKYLNPPLSYVLLIGGVPAGPQLTQLTNGCNIVVGTPGRIMEFVDTGKLSLSHLRALVLDEADALIDGGHQEILLKIAKSATSGGVPIQIQMFSATLHSPSIKTLAAKICNHPIWIDLKGTDSVPESVHHTLVQVEPVGVSHLRPSFSDGVHTGDNIQKRPENDEMVKSERIKRLKPLILKELIDNYKMEQVIVFCRTRLDCDNLSQWLNMQGNSGDLTKEYSNSVLHSGKGKDRSENLRKFKDGETRILICTDVAARGIDISGLPFLINFTLPDNTADYIHRVGRVGRAERMGLSISLIGTQKEKVWYHTCPSKGKQCKNTKLVENGGCTIWYDEKALIADIEKTLDFPIPILDSSNGYKFEGMEGVTYGEKKAKDNEKLEKFSHTEWLKPEVASLSELESVSQNRFFSLRYLNVLK